MFDKLAIALVSPLGTALALGVLALGLAGFGRGRLAGWLAALGLVWLWVWSLPVASHAVRGALEASYPAGAVQQLPRAQAIVVLGGGVGPAQARGGVPNLASAADRVWHGARLFHAGRAPLVVLSGGSDPQASATSEAAAMGQFLADLGVPAQATLLEERSRNTRQNAQHTAALLQPRGISHVLLVTSALHMHRAVALFEAQGLTVTPAPTDHEARQRAGAQDWLPSADALDGSARAMKEWVARGVGR